MYVKSEVEPAVTAAAVKSTVVPLHTALGVFTTTTGNGLAVTVNVAVLTHSPPEVWLAVNVYVVVTFGLKTHPLVLFPETPKEGDHVYVLKSDIVDVIVTGTVVATPEQIVALELLNVNEGAGLTVTGTATLGEAQTVGIVKFMLWINLNSVAYDVAEDQPYPPVIETPVVENG